MSDCQRTREQLLDVVRGRLAEPQRTQIAAHLQTCGDCGRLLEREQALDRALELRPRFPLPDRLRETLAATATGAKVESSPRRLRPRLGRWAAVAVPSLAAALLAVMLVRGPAGSRQPLIDEAINDHLRVLYAQRPIEIESGGIHQVKPWFTGRLDFAPPVSFSGDEEFRMVGGAVGVFVDRKAATFIFKHRLHTITLLVFRNDGLPFPSRTNTQIAALPSSRITARGFNLLFWREGDLGYALVSDVEATALTRLATKIATH